MAKRKRKSKTRRGKPVRVKVSHNLVLRSKEAAKALSISERHLWSLTNRGEIPHLRLGRAVLYPVDQLREWMAREVKKKGGRR